MKRTVDFNFVIVRNGADYTTISPVKAPKIKCNRSGRIKTSFSGTFVYNEAVNWLTDIIRPEIVIDGEPHSLGVFIPATVRREKTDTQELVTIEAYDRCWFVMDNYAEAPVYFASGTLYLDAINQILASCGIALISQVDNTAAFAEAREDWNTGTSYLEVVNQLLSEINYKPLWFDAKGVAVLEPFSDPIAENVQHTFNNSNVKSLILPRITRGTDLYKTPNVFLCVCSNPDKAGEMTATSKNTNPQSPLSIDRRGRKITTVIQVDNIASQEELQKYADNLRNQSMFSGETISISTALLPGFGVGDIVSLLYDDISTICIEQAWEMRLEVGGEMNHTLERVVVNLG